MDDIKIKKPPFVKKGGDVMQSMTGGIVYLYYAFYKT